MVVLGGGAVSYDSHDAAHGWGQPLEPLVRRWVRGGLLAQAGDVRERLCVCVRERVCERERETETGCVCERDRETPRTAPAAATHTGIQA